MQNIGKMQPHRIVLSLWIILVMSLSLARGCCRTPSCPQTTCPPPPPPTIRPVTTPQPIATVSLTQLQKEEIRRAQQSGFLDQLRNRTFAYNNDQPVVTLTPSQEAEILNSGCYGAFFNNSLPDTTIDLWDDGESTQILPEGPSPVQSTQNPFGGRSTSPPLKRRKRAANNCVRTCPVTRLSGALITAFNADDQPVQVVQLSNADQLVVRERCNGDLSDSATATFFDNNVYCALTTRMVPLVVIRLDAQVTRNDDVTVEQVQVEACSSTVIPSYAP